MKTPTFDERGIDRTTFAPFWLRDARTTEWQDVRLGFHDWEWFHSHHATDTIDGYSMNGYGLEGLLKAIRWKASRPVEGPGIDYDSEGDTCFVHFKNLDEAIWTAEQALQFLSSRETLADLIAVARAQGFED